MAAGINDNEKILIDKGFCQKCYGAGVKGGYDALRKGGTQYSCDNCKDGRVVEINYTRTTAF